MTTLGYTIFFIIVLQHTAGLLITNNASVATLFTVQSNALYLPHDSQVACEILYVLDTGNNRVITVNRTSGVANLFVGVFPGFENGVGSDARFDDPRGFTFTRDISIMFIADTANNAMRKVHFATANVSTLAIPNLVSPNSVEVDDSYLYISTNNKVVVIDIVYNEVVWQTSGELVAPCGLALNGSSTLYISDQQKHQIYSLSLPAFTLTLYAGTGVAAYADKLRLSAAFNAPTGLAFMWSHLFISDTGNHVVRVINTITDEVTTLAGVPQNAGYVDGRSGIAQFNSPRGLYTHVNDIAEPVLYVADRNNNKIRIVTLHNNHVAISDPPSACIDTPASYLPTAYPSTSPTTIPSVLPTSVPTSKPTSSPSRKPTVAPSKVPTVLSSDPTSIPTPSFVSNRPNTLPSPFPTPPATPTNAPTTVSTSIIPSMTSTTSTYLPTSVPTRSLRPTVSSEPPVSVSPTMSSIPSLAPQPVFVPTTAPSTLENITRQSRDGDALGGLSITLWIIIAVLFFFLLSACITCFCLHKSRRNSLNEHAALASTDPRRMVMMFR